MSKISLVLFDLDDVLCTYDRPSHIAQIAALAGKHPEEVYTSIWVSGYDRQGDSGLFDADEYLRGCGDRIGYPLTRAEWVAGRKATTLPVPGMLDLIQLLKPGTQIAILTNNTTLVSDHIEEFAPGLQPLFKNAVYVSAEFFAVKPEKEVYLRCLAKLNVEVHQALFIDDLEENVVGAKAAGLHADRYTTVWALKEILFRYELV